MSADICTEKGEKGSVKLNSLTSKMGKERNTIK